MKRDKSVDLFGTFVSISHILCGAPKRSIPMAENDTNNNKKEKEKKAL